MELKEKAAVAAPTTKAPVKNLPALAAKLSKVIETNLKGVNLMTLGEIIGLMVKKNVKDVKKQRAFMTAIKKGMKVTAKV